MQRHLVVVILREACGSHVVHVTVKSPSIENYWGGKNMWELPSLAVLGWTIQIPHSKEHGEGAVYAAKPPFFWAFFFSLSILEQMASLRFG